MCEIRLAIRVLHVDPEETVALAWRQLVFDPFG